MVVFIVDPFIGLPLSACSTRGCPMHPSAQPSVSGKLSGALILYSFEEGVIG
jgi:hypothetical protein